MPFQALFHFAARLRIVGKYRGVVFFCQGCHPFQQIFGSRVFGMEPKAIPDPAMVMVKPLVFLFQLLQRRVEIIEAADQGGPEATFHGSPGNHFRIKIHIKVSRNAAGQILQDC